MINKQHAIGGISVGLIFSIMQFSLSFLDKKNDKLNDRLAEIERRLDNISMKISVLETTNNDQQAYINRNRDKIDKLIVFSIKHEEAIDNIKLTLKAK